MVCNCSREVWKYIKHLDRCDSCYNSDSSDSSDSGDSSDSSDGRANILWLIDTFAHLFWISLGVLQSNY